MRLCLPGLLLCATVASAQDVGMGARQGSAKRFESPYTFEIQTPHVKWANPLPGGPIRLLAVPTVSEGRTVVELAQRFSLDLTTVSIDPDWDVNKWTMSFGKDYGARAEKGDLKLVYSYLEQELTGPKKFEAILLPLNHGWEMLTPASRAALKRRVQEGCGLVLIRPYAGELSPLIPLDLKADLSELEEPQQPGKTEASPWRRTREHYITRAVPVESFPFGDVQNFLYKAAPGADVLVRTESGTPVLAEMRLGKGRVIAFGYRNHGLSWHMPMDARGRNVDVYWEYFYSLLGRAVMYAAGREPAARADLDGPAAAWRLRSESNRVVSSGKGRPPRFDGLEPGRYFLEQQAGADWRITELPGSEPARRIEHVKVTPEVIAEGSPVEVRWDGGHARIELADGFGRVIAAAQGEGNVRLTAARPLTHSGFVRAIVGSSVQQFPVRFAASSREWEDYEVIMPWYGPRSYQPWIPAVDEQFRRAGITTLATPERNFKMMVSAHLPGFGIYWYRRDEYLKKKAGFAATKDKKYLTREIAFESADFEKGLRAQLDKSLRPLAPLRPMATYLSDESSVTFYADAFDLDFSPESIAGFRQWLRREYKGLDDLNATWSTAFASWDAVLPMTTEEAQKHGNFAPWADHRTYMERQFVQAFETASKLVHEIDPGGRASISGTQVPTAHNGANWYDIDQRIDYLQPYSGGNQDAMHHLFRPGLIITGFTGYGLVGDEVQQEQWRRLFYGHRGASIFWHYTVFNPDLALSEQGRALAEAFGKIQSGVGRVFMNSAVREDGIAVHFSMASMRGAWITDGKIAAELGNSNKTSTNFAELERRRDAWVKELERQGAQFRFLATPQIEAGMLDRYRVLILPYSIAITDAEAKEIERFLDRGGVVYADDQTGRMDGRCRWRKQPLWKAGAKGLVRGGPRDLGLKREFGAEALVTVRDFGESRLTGVLPDKLTKLRMPAGGGVAYDLFRGGIASDGIDAGPSRPVLLLERKSRIARLTLDAALNLRLTDDGGAPVDISVARLEVFDPEGRFVRHYSSNVTVRNGQASAVIPFALNDAAGRWRVRARDVVSGLTAETQVSR